MDRKNKIKFTIDILMACVFLLLMNVGITGTFLHEVIGLCVLVPVFVHLALNKQWIAGVARRFKRAGAKAKGRFVLNFILAVAVITCGATGVLISRYIFPWLSLAGNTALYAAHVVSAYSAIALFILHTALHWRWIRGFLQKARTGGARLRTFAARAAAGLIATATIYTLIAGDAPIKAFSAAQSSPVTQTLTSAAPNTTSDNGDVVTSAAPVASEVTLDEFLGKLYCTGCHRHCPLTSPQCSIGVAQAEEQTVVYEA